MTQLAAVSSAHPVAGSHVGTQSHTVAHTGDHHGNAAYWQNLGTLPLILNVLPFVALLLMIAILPLIPKVDHWWHHNKNKLMVAGICGLMGIGLYLFPTGDWHKIVHTYVEYLAFMMLLASLFIISGGIYISGPFAGFPHINTLFLALGAIIANLMGTTGASMLLIRPLLTANKPRKHKTHIVVFFIFIVSNCGGLLTPLGDPPLYLGFLRGVPFNWTLRLFPEWITVIGGLLLIFLMLDSYMFAKEELATKESLTHEVQAKAEGKRLRIDGAFNFVFLGLVIGTILASGYLVHPWLKSQFGLGNADLFAGLFQAGTMGLIAFISYRLTQPVIRESNHFSFEPIFEVACLFVGIFGAMIPALTLLEAKSATLALSQPWHYFWASGLLSGFLDNAPTYLTFVTLAAGKNGLPSSPLTEFVLAQPALLAAVSCGSVFMGALSYIGNGPNFMVKAIAEHAHVKMPSFGGYMLWSFTFLVPFFVLVTFLFFLH